MSSSTGKYGIPYSEGTDSVDTIDETMQGLAQRLDLLLGESDTTTIQAAGAGVVTKRVNYGRDYSSVFGGLGFTPRASVQLVTNHADTILWVESEDATGFTLGLRTTLAGTAIRTVRWFVRGVKA